MTDGEFVVWFVEHLRVRNRLEERALLVFAIAVRNVVVTTELLRVHT